ALVFVNFFGVRKNSRRARHVAEHGFRRWNGFGRGQIIHERRSKVRRCRVFFHFRGVCLVHRLFGVASWRGFSIGARKRRRGEKQRDGQKCFPEMIPVHEAPPEVHTQRRDCSAERGCPRSTKSTKSPSGFGGNHSAAMNLRQTGEGTATLSPVGVSCPVLESTWNATIVSLNCFSTKRKFPEGSNVKW